MELRERPRVQPTLSNASRASAPVGLVADPSYRLSVSEPIEAPRRGGGLASPRLLISLAGLTGGLAILYSALRFTGILG